MDGGRKSVYIWLNGTSVTADDRRSPYHNYIHDGVVVVILRNDVCDNDGQEYICVTGRGYRFIVKAQYSLSLSSYNVLMFYLPGAMNG